MADLKGSMILRSNNGTFFEEKHQNFCCVIRILFLSVVVPLLLILRKSYSLLNVLRGETQRRRRQSYRDGLANQPRYDDSVYHAVVVSWKWKWFVVFLGTSLFGSGIVIIATVNRFIKNSENMCRNPSASVLRTHPELNLWSYCDKKVMHF